MPIQSDQEWEAESDANTLAESTVIKADEGRFANAKTAAKRLEKETEKRLQGYRNIIQDNGMTVEQARKKFPNSFDKMFPGL